MVEFYLNFDVSEKIFQADYPDDIPGRLWNKKPSLVYWPNATLFMAMVE